MTRSPVKKSRFLPSKLGYLEVPLPSPSSYLITNTTQATVLDQFYSMVVFKSIPPMTGVSFDTTKVCLNPDDGQNLHAMLTDHYHKLLDEEWAVTQANGVWERFAPKLDPSVPHGRVRLMDGYIKFAD